jgi:hypothetical protein
MSVKIALPDPVPKRSIGFGMKARDLEFARRDAPPNR